MATPTQMEQLKTGIITVPEQTKKSADKTGFLTKQGGKWKTWKKRYFVLKNNFLYYFSEPKDTVPKGVILLEGTRVNKAEKDSKRKFCFSVNSRRSFTAKTGWRDRVYFFQADNETEMNQWIKAITSAAPGKRVPHSPQLTEQVNKLFKASGKGDIATVKQLLESEKVDTSCCDEDGNTALHWACVGGHIEVVKLLLQHSTDIEVKNKDGFTPLHSCAQEDRKVVMELLVTNGAKLDTPNTEDNENTSLHYAACWGAVECTKLLLSKGATVDARAADKSTPLSFAAEKGHVTIARLLIEAGASLESKNDPEEKGGATPLLLAAHNGQLEIVRLLLQKKSNIKETTIDGLNCLHLAIRSGSDNDELLRILIEGGADVNGKTNNGDTALHYAAYMGYMKSAAILIEKGGSTEERGQNFSTPLHFAAREGQFDVLKLLLDKGADVNVKDKDGDTPLACSELNGFTRCVELLREKEK